MSSTIKNRPRSKDGSFTFIPTPIGNFNDLSFRALDALKQSDIILCEDTRVTGKLLSHYGISKPLYTLHDHNEKFKTEKLLEQASQDGIAFAVVSDAGTPIVSDPGYYLLKYALEANIKVEALPGPNACVTALVLSGLPPFPSTLMGFLPRTKSERNKLFNQIAETEKHGFKSTYIFYESPRRLLNTIEDLEAVFGPDRKAVVARELTKTYEEILRHSLSELKEHFNKHEAKGEITLLLAPGEEKALSKEEISKTINALLKDHRIKEASKIAAEVLNISKREAYQLALELKGQN